MSSASVTGTPESLSRLLAELDAGERGFVLGRLATAGAGGDLTDAVVAGVAGRRCAAVLERVANLPRAERLRLMDALGRDGLGPVPAGTEHLHPDALRPLLEPESSATLGFFLNDGLPPVLRATAAAVLAERPAEEAPVEPAGSGAAAQEVRRAVLAVVIPVSARPSSAGPNQRPGLVLAALQPESLLSELTAAGAELLGISLRGADPARIDQAAALAGPPWTERVRAAALGQGIAPAGGGRSWTVKRARALLAATGPAGTPQETLRRLGASALGVRLGADDPGLIPALAQRLPAELAQRLRASAGS